MKTTLLGRGLFPYLLVVLGAACAPPEDASSAEGEMTEGPAGVAEWVKANAKDVPSLKLDSEEKQFAEMLKGFVDRDVELLGLGENVHGSHEYNQLRTKVFKYLVENQGFRAIVPETGILESRIAEQYVQGVAGVELDTVLKQGFTHHMGLEQSARELVEWMRRYNEGKSAEQRVHFGGKDLSLLGDTLTVPLTPLQAYLEEVDPTFASSTETTSTMELANKASAVTLAAEAAFKAKGANEIEPDFLDAFGSISFEQLSTEEQSALEQGVLTIASHVASQKAEYTAASSEDDYEWNARLVEIAKQSLRDLRSRQKHPKIYSYDKVSELITASLPDVVLDSRPASDPSSHTMDMTKATDLQDQMRGRETREQALAENVTWVQKRYGRTLNFAQNGHIHKTGLDKIVFKGVEFGDIGRGEGEFITETYGKRYALVGSTHIDFEDAQGKPLTKFQGAPAIPVEKMPDSFEHDVMEIVRPRKVGVFIDLKHAKDLPSGFGKRSYRWVDSFQELDLRKNYDGMFILSAVTPQHDPDGH